MIIYRTLLFAAIGVWLFACQSKKGRETVQVAEGIMIDSMPGNCPYLTKDTKGNIVISWAKELNDSTSVFCYAVSADGGQSFGKSVEIPNSDNIQPHSENLPKIIFKPSGEIMALWGTANPNPKNKYSGLVFYSQSFNEGRTWSSPRGLVSDTAGYDQRYYDVSLLPNNEVAIIWLDNRKSTDREGSALYIAVSQGTNGFTGEKMIGQYCCPCCRTDLFADSKGNIHVLYRGIVQDSIRDMVHIVSGDGGQTFSAPKRISNDNWVINGCPHTGPSMTENQEGLHFAWFTGGRNKGCFYTRSVDTGKSFMSPDRISPLGSHPQISSFPGGDLLVAWDESVQVNNKYYKKIAIQKRTGSGKSGSRAFLTADTTMATYPVVANLGNNASVIAYTVKKGDNNFVLYQRARFE